MIKSLMNWFDDRTGIKGLLHEALYERIPGGARWRYVWGSTLIFTFSLQMITGILLWTAYSPSGQTAWESVYYIQEVMTMGSVVRGIHHYCAQIMVVLLGIHLIQVIIDGAYRAPREVNFWLGLILMQIVLALSLTGYLLPWDQKGYYATKVSTKIMGATPMVGPELQNLVQGGPEYGHHTLTRFFAMHAGVLPGLLIAFLALHLYVFRRHGITVKDPDRAPETTFWPDQVLKDGVACLGVLAVIMGLAIFKGAELSAPANPAEAYAAARPEWYFLSLFRFLKFEAVEHFGLAFGAIYVPGALMGIITLMPIIAMAKGGHKFNVVFLWTLAFCVVGLTTLAMIEDRNDPEHQAAIAEADRDAHRVLELAKRPEKIPVEGATRLLQEDPFTQGPRLFAKHCASCHRYDGHNGRGRMVAEVDPDSGKSIASRPTAVDLANFGSRKWMRSVIVDYPKHFTALKNSKWYQDESADEKLDPDESEMAQWYGGDEEKASLLAAENRENLNAVVEYLASLANRSGQSFDPKLVSLGRDVATSGTWAGDLEGTSCSDCHTMADQFKRIELDEGDAGYPDLSGYGSQAWLLDFLKNPGSNQHYGPKNQMPAYESRLTETESKLLVRWLTKDFHQSEIADYPKLTGSQ